MKYLMTFLILIFCCWISYDGDSSYFSERVFLTSMIIQAISIIKIFGRTSMPYSLNKAFYMFALFFWGIAPILQLYARVSFFGARLLHENEYFFMNILIIGILIIYEIFYSFFLKKKPSEKTQRIIKQYELSHGLTIFQSFLLISISTLSFCLVFYSNNGSLLSMLIRGGEFKESTTSDSTSINLIINQFIRPLSILCLFYFICSRSRNYTLLFALVPLALITCSPLGMPRFAAAALYIPLLLLTVKRLTHTPYMFSLAFVLGILVVFPFLDIFRVFNENTNASNALKFDSFLQGHYDSYQNFTLIVSEDIVTWGRQLLGVILFWTPRAVWPGKPIGTGAMLGEKLNFEWTNISANYFAEGYVNFSFAGIFLFACLLSYLTARIDRLYWTDVFRNRENFIRVAYFILIGMIFFILRGDLLSAFAYTVGILFAFISVFKVLSLGKKVKLKEKI